MQVVFEIIGMGAKKYGGFEHYILEEAKQLNSKGKKLVVIFDVEPLAREYVNDLLVNGASYYVVPYVDKLQFIKRIFHLIQEYKPSVVHTNFSSCGFIVHLLALLKHVSCRIATEHCLPVLSTLKLQFAFLFMSSIVHNIIPVSKESTKALKKRMWFNKDKVQTLYLGVNDFDYDKSEMRKKYNLPVDKILLINIAYHNPIKGVDVLLRALSELVRVHHVSDIVLCQIGGGQNGADTASLKKIAKELDIEQYIIWMGLQNKVSEILSAGDIYCQPSRSEGIPLSIMEASLARLPIVATRVGGNPEAAIDGVNAKLVPVEDFSGIAKAIYELYEDADKRNEYGIQGRKFALENFSLKEQVNHLITCYYKL